MEGTNETRNYMTSSLADPVCANAQAYNAGGKAMEMLRNPPTIDLGLFSHTVQTKANSIKFAHQSMCSPRITTLLKAIQRGFLKGCPNLSAKGVKRYLN
jgi:hypothetical protein